MNSLVAVIWLIGFYVAIEWSENLRRKHDPQYKKSKSESTSETIMWILVAFILLIRS